MSELLPAAREWVSEVHPDAHHLLATEAWLEAIASDAAPRLRIAAVLHDIERAFPDPDAGWDSFRDWASPVYNRWHQDRCARIAADWLRAQDAPEDLVAEVAGLIAVHEDGGWPRADLLQAADSLSFLDTMIGLVVGWARRGGDGPRTAIAKLQSSLDRIHPELGRARELGRPMLERGLAEVRQATAAAPAR
ncbi:MAG: hypothetical protein JOZ07_11705 [Solirubrobacterales bacterium]|nr:hypothetical protein [Solirubrobacterales bacterium]